MQQVYYEEIALQDFTSYGGVLARVENYEAARPPSGYLPGQLCTIQMPIGMMDFRGHSLQFTIQGTPGTGATYTRLSSDIRCIFKRLVISFGSKPVLDIMDYNVLCNILNNTKDVNWPGTFGKACNGVGSAAERNGWFTNVNKVYAIQLYDLN